MSWQPVPPLSTIPARDRIMVALDAGSLDMAVKLAKPLVGKVRTVKVGKELFVAEGPKAVETIRDLGFEIFLDLKFHDIPQTVRGACRSAAKLGVSFLTVHAAGGAPMLYMAAQGAREGAEAAGVAAPKILAVTILTSIDQPTYDRIGFNGTIEDTVARLAKLAYETRADGVVCSPREAALVKRTLADATREPEREFIRPEPYIVTPGVRAQGASTDDQSRVLTAAEAIREGSTHLVIGRPILWAEDPPAAVESFVAEIEAALGRA
jgi:orotidine-5'-phosphate decarboxylase